MKTFQNFTFTFLIIFACISCNHSDQKAITGKKFLDLASIDSTVKPGDDFYHFVNGKWIRNTIIPITQSDVGGFIDLYYQTQDILHKLLDSLSKVNHVTGSIGQKVGDLYLSGMDTITIDKKGYEPLKPYLVKISAIQSVSDIVQFANSMQKENQNILYNIGIGPDDKNSSINILSLYQGGLGLPDRDYYFKKDSASLAIVKAYRQYIEKLFILSGDDSLVAHKKSIAVYDLEKQMAESHKSNVALRDPQSNYHKIAISKLDYQMPSMAWKTTLTSLGIETDSVNQGQPAYYVRLNELLTKTSIDDWKAYLQFHTIDAYAPYLSNSFEMASFYFYSTVLHGQEKKKPRWNKVVAIIDGNLGEGLGEIYVHQYFSKEAKDRMLELVNNLQIAFEARINKLDWMSDSTKAKARDKLHAFVKKIGYPDKWRDYSKVKIDKLQFFENVISCKMNDYQRAAGKIGKPVDKSEWGMTPPTINAYYNPSFNEVVFPAGILQPPFFDPAADDAVNYGAIGMGIGHEMTHGFDDQGAQYDKDGNLKNWWSKQDSVKFVDLTKTVKVQYDGFIAIDTFHVNGALTTGENIADLGGLNIAYDAFKLTKQGQDTIRIDGLLPDERFFLSFATIWRNKAKDAYRRMLVNVDTHSPDQFRVIGTLENFTPFYISFNIQKGDKMYKPETERIKIW